MALNSKSGSALLLACVLLASSASAQTRVLVIESEGSTSGHSSGQVMDAQWISTATAAGYSVTIGRQSDLLTNAYYASTDVLVISSGSLSLPTIAGGIIDAFLGQGGNVYLQGEWQSSYTTNQLFATLVNGNGGTFTWGNTLTGALQPVVTLAPLDGPLAVPPLGYFWYGVTGVGTGVNVAMQDSGGNDVGWTFEYPNGARLIHSCDQDWVRDASFEDRILMSNMLHWLSNGSGAGPSVYCDPPNPNSISAAGAILTSTGNFGMASATFAIDNLPNSPGLLFAGSNTLDSPFGCGRLCISGNITRGAVQFPTGNQVNVTFDMTQPGTTNIQYWYKDVANQGNCGSLFNLSNALMP